ncbi:hypothetical protein TKK_0018633 [Trichogramma kaykai]
MKEATCIRQPMRPVLITSEQRPLACETPGKRRPIPPRLADREMETLSDSFCGLVIRIPEVHLHDKVPKSDPSDES